MDYNTYLAARVFASSAEKIFGGNTGLQLPRNPLVPAVPTNIVLPADLELESYTKRVDSEDGLYTIIKEHREWVEGIPQPLTDAEIAAQQARARENSKIALGVGLAATSVVAGLYLFRDKIFGS